MKNNTEDPLQYLIPERFDVAAKILYAKHRILNVAEDYAKTIYKHHLFVMQDGDIHEYDGSKYNFNDFVLNFNNLLISLENKGFDGSISKIPVCDSFICNGAHRIASSIVLKKTMIKQNFFPAQKIGVGINDVSNTSAKYFQRNMFCEESFNAMLLEYCKRKQNTRICVLFPMAIPKIDDAMNEITKQSKVIAYKDIVLEERGVLNLIHILHEGESWIRIGNGISGATEHLFGRYEHGKPIRFVFVEFEEEEIKTKSIAIKEKIRAFFNEGSPPIHIGDSHRETISLACQILHKESLRLLSISDTYKATTLHDMIREVKQCVPVDLWEHFVIDSGDVMAAYGIRDTADIDYIATENLTDLDKISFCSKQTHAQAPYKIPTKEMVWHPKNYVYFFWIKNSSSETTY